MGHGGADSHSCAGCEGADHPPLEKPIFGRTLGTPQLGQPGVLEGPGWGETPDPTCQGLTPPWALMGGDQDIGQELTSMRVVGAAK